MNIRVTADHIKRGRARSVCWCPVALAIAEAIPGSHPRVSIKITLLRDGETKLIESPESVCDFMTALDFGHEVRPFEFTLDLPWETKQAA